MRAYVCALACVLCPHAVSAQAPAVPRAASPAAACPESEAPHVDAAFVLGPNELVLAEKLEGHLRAALAARGIVFCLRPPQPGGTASLRIRVEGAQASIEISDALTEKHIARSIDLGRLPRDGWPLALAASSDELLRASWAELVLRDAPRPRHEPPAAVVKAVQSSVRAETAPRRIELAPELSALWQRWRRAFGPRLRFAYWLEPHWALLLGAAASFGLSEQSQHGSVRADTLDLELGAAYGLTPAQARLGASLELNLVVSRIAFAARANPDGASDSFADWSLASVLRVRGFYGAGPWRVSAALGVYAPLKPASARDEGKTVTASRGFGGEALLGVGAFF
jgi:hypothetical protein